MFLKEEGKKKDKNGHDRWKLCDDIKFWMGVPNFTKKCSTERVFHIIGRENDSDAKHCFDNVFDWPTVVESIWSVRIWLMNSNSGLTSFPLTYNCVHVAASYHHTCEGGKLEPRGGKAKDWWAYEFLSYKQKVIWASEHLSWVVVCFESFLRPSFHVTLEAVTTSHFQLRQKKNTVHSSSQSCVSRQGVPKGVGFFEVTKNTFAL